MRKKLRFFFFILLFVVLLFIAYIYILVNHVPDAKIALILPENFIALEEVMPLFSDGLRISFWESQVSILSENVCIYQTSIRDKTFIVKYRGKYYINQRMLSDLLG